jgi:membrane fusion protein (multidrug efflux system)
MSGKIQGRHLALVLGLVVAAGAGFLWYFDHRGIETTDDAYVRADSTAVSPKIAGYIAAVLVRENQHVKQGDALVRIDDRDYRARVDQAQAQADSQASALNTLDRQVALQQALIEQAAAAGRAAEANQRRAGAEFERDRKLMQQGYTTPEQFDANRAAAEAAQAAVAQAKAGSAAAEQQREVLKARRAEAESGLAAARSALAAAQLDLEHTQLVAPFDGIVGNRSVNVGDYVRPGTQLFVLVPPGQAFVVANFKETQIGRMAPGNAVDLEFDAYPGWTLHGRIESLSPATGSQYSLLPPENATGNFTKIVQRVPIKIVPQIAPEQADRLRPGLSVIVHVDTRATQPGA